jgi:hypothetical protein
MLPVIKFFSTYSPLVYLLLAICTVLSGRQLMRSLHEVKEAVFGLEREIIQRKINRYITALIIIILLAIGELTLSVFIVPILPGTSFLSSPTLNPLAGQTGTLPPEIEQSLGLVTPQVSPSPEVNGCIPGSIMLTAPKAGTAVKGIVTIKGIINVPNFGFYKYEYSLQSEINWLTIQAGVATATPIPDNPKSDDFVLGIWNTTLMTPGDYLLRLVIVDNQGNDYPPCVIPLQISPP